MKTIVRMVLPIVLVSLFILPVGFIPVRSVAAEEMATPLTAARNGLKAADDMVAQGKLDPGWATGLSSVAVTIRNIKGFSEYVVTLTRSSGSPAEVSIYLNMNGGYSGSSLDGSAAPGE